MSYFFEDLQVGMSAEFRKTITETDVVLFAGLTGDYNPMHIDHEFARGTRFGERIIHGMMTASLLSSTIGMKLPGPGCIYMSQNLRFLKPVHIGDTVKAVASILEIYPEKQRVKLLTECFVVVHEEPSVKVLEGDALVWVPKRPE